MRTVDGYRLTRAGLDDTSPEAHRVMAGIWRRMPVFKKAASISQMFETARRNFRSSLRRTQPSLSDEELQQRWLSEHCPDLPERRIAMAALSLQPDELNTLRTVVSALSQLGIRYAIGGSIASSLLGISRTTVDGDVCVEAFAGKEKQLVAAFDGLPDYYVSLPAVQEAVRSRRSFNIINSASGFKVDLFVQTSRPFEAGLLDRARSERLREDDADPVKLVSPEDCVLLKLEWYKKGSGLSDRQWQDVLGVLRVQQPDIDLEYMRRWAAELKVADLLDEALRDADLTTGES
jgi:hypothetical protein